MINAIKIFIILFIPLLLSACGGGGGSASSPIPINFTETKTATRGLVWVYKPKDFGDTPSHHAEEISFTSEALFGGFNWSQNASTDGFTVTSDTIYSTLDLNAGLNPTHITSGPTVSTETNTLSSTDYTYGYYDPSIAQNVYVKIIIPTNYPNQTWIYWDNSNYASSSEVTYNMAITGTPLAFASVPSNGTATYTGGMEGLYSTQSSLYTSVISGTSNFSVDWGASTISGSFTNMQATTNGSVTSFNNLTMPSTAIAASFYGSIASFEGNLQGTGFTYDLYNDIHGAFFGTNAESIGGTFEIQNNGATGAGAGYFAAGKN